MAFEESVAEAAVARYGDTAPLIHEGVAPFLRHRCIRKYSDQAVSAEMVNGLVAAAQNAGTSSYLQLWSIISVEDPQRRQAIVDVATYKHVGTAPLFFVFLADIYRLQHNSTGADALDYAEYYTMAVIDATLACERMVCAAEFVGLGTCYIGAVRNDPAKMAEILELPEGVFATVGLCIGWPAEEPEIKPRLAQSDVWFHDTYRRDVDVAEFDDRMRDYYSTRGQDLSITWSQRSARRANAQHMTGRQVLLEWLRGRGFLKR